MSFNHVHQYILRHPGRTSFIAVKNGRPVCLAADSKQTNRILRGLYHDIKPVGFYNADVDEVDLAQDLKYCGINT